MKRVITMLLLWQLFVNASEPTDEYVIFYEDENSVHKCKREDYLEMMSFMEFNSKRIQKHNEIESYLKWELDEKYNKRRKTNANHEK